MNEDIGQEGGRMKDEFDLPIQEGSLTGKVTPSLEEQQSLHEMLQKNKPKIVKKLKGEIATINGGNTGQKGE